MREDVPGGTRSIRSIGAGRSTAGRSCWRRGPGSYVSS